MNWPNEFEIFMEGQSRVLPKKNTQKVCFLPLGPVLGFSLKSPSRIVASIAGKCSSLFKTTGMRVPFLNMAGIVLHN